MTPHFFIFKVSNGNRDWNHALFLNGKWFNFNWDWYCDNNYDDRLGLRSTPLSTWDDMLKGEIPADQVKWVVPESDRDSGPYYVEINSDWLKNNHGIVIE